MPWLFRTYVSASGRHDVQADIDRLTELGSAMFSRQVAHLAEVDKVNWNEPHAKKLKAEKGLYEIRFVNGKVQTRALGYFGPGADEFTITLICTHKQDVYKPADAFDTAAKRYRAIQKGDATAVALQIHGEDFPADEDPSGG